MANQNAGHLIAISRKEENKNSQFQTCLFKIPNPKKCLLDIGNGYT
jgi:hypothetical protein